MSNPAQLTDEQIVAIRDEHLPSQGEQFDCIAFARAILAAAPRTEEIRKMAISNELRDEIKKTLGEFPPGYNAHADRLADHWDHAEAVNKLLKLLKRVDTDTAP